MLTKFVLRKFITKKTAICNRSSVSGTTQAHQCKTLKTKHYQKMNPIKSTRRFFTILAIAASAMFVSSASAADFKLKNEYGHDVLVHVFKNHDGILGIAAKEFSVKRGATATVNLERVSGKVTIKVFRKQIINALLFTKRNLEYNGSYKVNRSGEFSR